MPKSPLPVLFLTVFLDLVGFGIVIPLLPFYAESFNATPFLVGLLMASYSLMQFLFAPLWGRLSDFVGRRPVILVSVAGSALSMLAFAFANSFVTLLLARVFAGLAGANIAAAQAYVSDVTTRANRAKGMGMVGAAIGLGFIAGPAIGGYFGQFSFALPAFIAAGLSAINFVAAWFLLPESRPPEARGTATRRWAVLDVAFLRGLHGRTALVGLIVLGFVVTVAFSMMEATFGLWSERAFAFDATLTGYLFAFIGVVMVTVQGGLIGPLTKRFGERRLLGVGVAGLAVSLAAIPFSPTVPAVFALMAVLACAYGLTNPSLFALVSLESSADEQGGVLGVSQSLAALARVVGPLYAGAVFGGLGIGWPFWSGAVIMGAGFLLALAVLPRTARAARAERPEATP